MQACSTFAGNRAVRLPVVHARPVLPGSLFASKLRPLQRCSAASQDPYTVLGVEPDADNNAVQRAITKKKYENRFNPEQLKIIQEAENTLMMSALNQRLKKGTNKAIAYADREQLFPWRPKRWDATPKIILLFGAAHLAMVAYGFQQPQLGQIIFSGLVGIVGNVLKQNAISPPPKDVDMATEEEAGRGSRNLIRGFLLGVFATVAGMLLFSIPEMLVSKYGITLPTIPGVQNLVVSLKITGVALGNWLMTSFYY